MENIIIETLCKDLVNELSNCKIFRKPEDLERFSDRIKTFKNFQIRDFFLQLSLFTLGDLMIISNDLDSYPYIFGRKSEEVIQLPSNFFMNVYKELKRILKAKITVINPQLPYLRSLTPGDPFYRKKSEEETVEIQKIVDLEDTITIQYTFLDNFLSDIEEKKAVYMVPSKFDTLRITSSSQEKYEIRPDNFNLMSLYKNDKNVF